MPAHPGKATPQEPSLSGSAVGGAIEADTGVDTPISVSARLASVHFRVRSLPVSLLYSRFGIEQIFDGLWEYFIDSDADI